MWSEKNHVTKRQFPNYFWFPSLVLQGPFTRWKTINLNKIRVFISSIFYFHIFTFSITFKSTLLYAIWQSTLRSWWQQPLRKTWFLQCQNGAMTHISRKTKSCRQNALFLWTVKLMLWISNLFPHLFEITYFQKHIDGLLTDM